MSSSEKHALTTHSLVRQGVSHDLLLPSSQHSNLPSPVISHPSRGHVLACASSGFHTIPCDSTSADDMFLSNVSEWLWVDEPHAWQQKADSATPVDVFSWRPGMRLYAERHQPFVEHPAGSLPWLQILERQLPPELGGNTGRKILPEYATYDNEPYHRSTESWWHGFASHDVPDLTVHQPAIINTPAAQSFGSIGHPQSCQEACKYVSRSKGCKDGKYCNRCHLCRWIRKRKDREPDVFHEPAVFRL